MLQVQPAKLLIYARGETQTDVARAIGFRLATLNEALNGTRRPSAPLRAKLAEYLGVDRGELFVDPHADIGVELARRTREAQGLAPTVTDPAAIATVADLLKKSQ